MPHVAEPVLPEVVEIKSTLSGEEQRFPCALIEMAAGRAVLRYVSTRAVLVHGLTLPAGTVTFGYFWADRPYNVYHWQTPDGATLAFYANVCDRTSIAVDRLAWRDLTVDVLLTPAGRVEVLDQDELPLDLDRDVRAAIDRALAEILAAPGALMADLEQRSRKLRQRLAAGGARLASPGRRRRD